MIRSPRRWLRRRVLVARVFFRQPIAHHEWRWTLRWLRSPHGLILCALALFAYPLHIGLSTYVFQVKYRYMLLALLLLWAHLMRRRCFILNQPDRLRDLVLAPLHNRDLFPALLIAPVVIPLVLGSCAKAGFLLLSQFPDFSIVDAIGALLGVIITSFLLLGYLVTISIYVGQGCFGQPGWIRLIVNYCLVCLVIYVPFVLAAVALIALSMGGWVSNFFVSISLMLFMPVSFLYMFYWISRESLQSIRQMDLMEILRRQLEEIDAPSER